MIVASGDGEQNRLLARRRAVARRLRTERVINRKYDPLATKQIRYGNGVASSTERKDVVTGVENDARHVRRELGSKPVEVFEVV